MIKFNIPDKKGVWIGEGDYHREVKLFSSPNSDIVSDFALGITIIGPGKKHEEHVHDANKEIMIVTSGEGIMTSNGKEYHVKKDDIMGFDFNEPHGFINTGDENLSIVWIYHPPGLAEQKFLVK